MIEYHYLVQMELHCSRVILHLDMVSCQYQVPMVLLLLVLHSLCCMLQELLQVQQWFQ